jgi:hypothetical protein
MTGPLLPVPSDDWLAALAAARDAGEPCALITVVSAEGSAPRDGGTKMAVTARGQAGSIGGGHLELRALETARAMLKSGERAPRVETYALGPALAQVADGLARLNGVDLLEWFVVGRHGATCPRLLAGDPERWCGPCNLGRAPRDRVHAVPVRFIVACEDGHLDEFPWRRWCGCKCDKMDLRLDTIGPGLGGKVVRCASCAC